MPKDTSRRVTPTNLLAFHHPSIARGRPIAPGKLKELPLPPNDMTSKPLTRTYYLASEPGCRYPIQAEIRQASTSAKAKRSSVDLRKQKKILEQAMLVKCGEVLQYKKPSDPQRAYIEKENKSAGIRYSKSTHTRWFNTYCCDGRIKKPLQPLEDTELSKKDQAWLDRFDRLKAFDEKVEKGPITMLNCSGMKIGVWEWEPEGTLDEPPYPICYYADLTGSLVLQWVANGLHLRGMIRCYREVDSSTPANPEDPEGNSDTYSHTFFLNSQPVYHTWALIKHKDETESWSWKEMEDDRPDTVYPIAVTLTGDATLRTDIDNITNSTSFTRKPGSKAARRKRVNRKPQANAADAPAAFQEGRMPASEFQAISMAADVMHYQYDVTWQSSTSQDGDESRGGVRTVSSGSYGSRVPVKAGDNNIFDRMKANNELGRAILSRWTEPAPEPIVTFAANVYDPIDFAAMYPQCEDDIFGGGLVMNAILPPEGPSITPLQHHHDTTWNDQEIADIFRELNSTGLLDCLDPTNNTSASLIPPQTISNNMDNSDQPFLDWYRQAPDPSSFDLNDLYEQPNLSLDNSISFNSFDPLPLLTPSQSLELLLQAFESQNHTQHSLPTLTTHDTDTWHTLPIVIAHELDRPVDTTFMPPAETDKPRNTHNEEPLHPEGSHEPQQPFSFEDLGIDWTAITIPDMITDEGQYGADETFSPIDFLADW